MGCCDQSRTTAAIDHQLGALRRRSTATLDETRLELGFGAFAAAIFELLLTTPYPENFGTDL